MADADEEVDETTNEEEEESVVPPVGDQSKKKNTRSPNFSGYEDFILCRAYSKTSNDPVKGACQKGSVFWESVYVNYVSYTNRFLEKHCTMNPFQFFKSRTAKMLENRKNELFRLIKKFNSVRKTHPKKSGEDHKKWYERITPIYLTEIGRKKCQLYEYGTDMIHFDIPEFVKDNPKFLGDATKLGDRPLGNRKAKSQLKLTKAVATKAKQLGTPAPPVSVDRPSPVSSLTLEDNGPIGEFMKQMSGTMQLISGAIATSAEAASAQNQISFASQQMSFVSQMVSSGKSDEEIQRWLALWNRKPSPLEQPTLLHPPVPSIGVANPSGKPPGVSPQVWDALQLPSPDSGCTPKAPTFGGDGDSSSSDDSSEEPRKPIKRKAVIQINPLLMDSSSDEEEDSTNVNVSV